MVDYQISVNMAEYRFAEEKDFCSKMSKTYELDEIRPFQQCILSKFPGYVIIWPGNNRVARWRSLPNPKEKGGGANGYL